MGLEPTFSEALDPLTAQSAADYVVTQRGASFLLEAE